MSSCSSYMKKLRNSVQFISLILSDMSLISSSSAGQSIVLLSLSQYSSQINLAVLSVFSLRDTHGECDIPSGFQNTFQTRGFNCSQMTKRLFFGHMGSDSINICRGNQSWNKLFKKQFKLSDNWSFMQNLPYTILSIVRFFKMPCY